MIVQEITQKNIWDSFIQKTEPNTFLHTWQWGEFEQSMGRFIIRLGVFENNNLVAVVLFSKITARRGTFLLCPHGPIISKEYNSRLEEIIKVITEKIVAVGKDQKCDFVRISTLTLDSEEHQKVFKKSGYRNSPIHMHSELAWILDVTPTEDVLLKNMRKNTRYAIRKAEKDGVEVVTSTDMKDLELFWHIYTATAERQNFTPYSKDFIEKEFKLFIESGQGVIFFGKYKGEAISTAFIVYSNGSGFYHHGASIQKYQGISASELVQWNIIQEAKRRGCKHYNFWGISPEDAVKHPWYGLSKFKRGFGGYAEQYVHAQDYVITSKYWLNYIVEKVRKIKRGL